MSSSHCPLTPHRSLWERLRTLFSKSLMFVIRPWGCLEDYPPPLHILASHFCRKLFPKVSLQQASWLTPALDVGISSWTFKSWFRGRLSRWRAARNLYSLEPGVRVGHMACPGLCALPQIWPCHSWELFPGLCVALGYKREQPGVQYTAFHFWHDPDDLQAFSWI